MRRFNLSLEKTPVKASIRFATFAATSFLLLAASPARADVTWNVQQGDWSVATNWSGGALPTSTDNADIFNGGTATITTTGDTCSTLSLGNTAGSGAINMTSGSFTVSGSAFVGFSGTGTFTQSGGTNNVTYGNQGAVYLGYNVGSNGTYSLGSSGLLSAWSETVGNSGTGNFTQSGGTNTISRNLYIGESAGSNGTYNLSGGLLSVGSDAYNVGETLGYNGMGAFIQSGGTNTTNILYLNTGATYNLSNTGCLSPTEEYVGWSGAGTFTQSGGTNTISDDMILGEDTYSVGTFNLSGNAVLSTSDNEVLAVDGTGIFTQTGGSNAVSHWLIVGDNTGKYTSG